MRTKVNGRMVTMVNANAVVTMKLDLNQLNEMADGMNAMFAVYPNSYKMSDDSMMKYDEYFVIKMTVPAKYMNRSTKEIKFGYVDVHVMRGLPLIIDISKSSKPGEMIKVKNDKAGLELINRFFVTGTNIDKFRKQLKEAAADVALEEA